MIMFARYVSGYRANVVEQLLREWLSSTERLKYVNNDLKLHDTFEYDGITYVVRRERRGCAGCVFWIEESCHQFEVTNAIRRCNPEARYDNIGVIFEVKKK